MASVAFTKNLERHVPCPRIEAPVAAPGATLREVLEHVFAQNPRLRGYVVDERGVLRKHMVVFIDGQQVVDRATLSDVVAPTSEVYVMQALSGG